jgi:hypothetical protein
MEAWAEDEDGIHPAAWEVYCRAKAAALLCQEVRP